MNLSQHNFFGPQEYLSNIVEYPPYSVTVKMKRYGYETGTAIYDVCIPERPIGINHLTRWYKVNGESRLDPTAIHKAIEGHYNL